MTWLDASVRCGNKRIDGQDFFFIVIFHFTDLWGTQTFQLVCERVTLLRKDERPVESPFPCLCSQKPVSCWGMHRLWSGRSYTAMMDSASCPDTTELRSCTRAARASKRPSVPRWGWMWRCEGAADAFLHMVQWHIHFASRLFYWSLIAQIVLHNKSEPKSLEISYLG